MLDPHLLLVSYWFTCVNVRKSIIIFLHNGKVHVQEKLRICQTYEEVINVSPTKAITMEFVWVRKDWQENEKRAESFFIIKLFNIIIPQHATRKEKK